MVFFLFCTFFAFSAVKWQFRFCSFPIFRFVLQLSAFQFFSVFLAPSHAPPGSLISTHEVVLIYRRPIEDGARSVRPADLSSLNLRSLAQTEMEGIGRLGPIGISRHNLACRGVGPITEGDTGAHG